MNDYERLRELAEKATPGPWGARGRFGITIVPGIIAASHIRYPVKDRATNGHEGETRHDLTALFVGEDKDAEFIAEANPDAIRNLLEDLRLTRQERDQEKRKNLALSKDNALLQRALEAVEGYVGRLEHEREALRRGQGRAPEPGAPEHPPFHHTHPIPDSTKGDQ